MPKYRIQLKQGKRTLVEHGEYKSVTAVLAHFQTISTMKVTEILKVEYEDLTLPPIDDYNYYSLFKGIIKNSNSRMSKQVIFHNIKLTKNETDIYNSCMLNMEINNLMVDSCMCSLFKK
ncbi:MAG: hypothetical protein NTZ60_02185 [Campylobacterales bacterium]|nr:hypothetical protein [Campylobacterales bacterium]